MKQQALCLWSWKKMKIVTIPVCGLLDCAAELQPARNSYCYPTTFTSCIVMGLMSAVQNTNHMREGFHLLFKNCCLWTKSGFCSEMTRAARKKAFHTTHFVQSDLGQGYSKNWLLSVATAGSNWLVTLLAFPFFSKCTYVKMANSFHY